MNWIPVGFFGGLVGLDSTALLQVMLSRPLPACALTGLLYGRPAEGTLIGILLEAFAIVVLPIGAARYPESGTAAVAASAAYFEAAGPALDAPLLLLAVAFGLVWETVTGPSVMQIRRVNERLLATVDVGPAIAARLQRRHLIAIGVDFLRGAVVTLVGAAAGTFLLRQLGGLWALGPTPALGALAVAATAMLAAALALFGGWKRRRVAFTIGVACGSLVLLLR